MLASPKFSSQFAMWAAKTFEKLSVPVHTHTWLWQPILVIALNQQWTSASTPCTPKKESEPPWMNRTTHRFSEQGTCSLWGEVGQLATNLRATTDAPTCRWKGTDPQKMNPTWGVLPLRHNPLCTSTPVGFRDVMLTAERLLLRTINSRPGAGRECELISAKHPRLAKLRLSYWHIKRQLCIKGAYAERPLYPRRLPDVRLPTPGPRPQKLQGRSP